ncbi:unnamed protein product [Larinioides sclopetarius]|uniref:Secreted protein n=1 Tax=Larinioides sclopetarius TaxID=280406 RepID=A0AAV1ZF80_9ARAC
MILSALFLTIMFAGSFACSDDHCKDPSLPGELIAVNFLPNEKQLGRLCPKVLSFLECERDFLECPGRTLEELATSSDRREASGAKGMLGSLSLVRDLCDEDSSFNHDYLASVDCFRDVFEEVTRTCRDDVLAPVENFFDEIYPMSDELHAETLAEMSCLRDAFELACIVDNLGDSCGTVAQRTAVNALERMKALLKAEICADVKDVADLKSRFLDTLELDEKRRSNFQEIFDLVKRRR